MSAPWPSVSRRYVNAGSLSTIALALAFAAAFFSKFLVEMGMVAGWLSVLVARRAIGAGEKAPARPAPIGLLVPLALFFLISGLSASLSLAPGHGWRLIAGEALGAGLAFAAAGLTSPAQARFVTAMFLGVGGFAGAWSIYQYVFEFGGVVDPGHRTYGFMRPVDFVWYGDMMVMVFALALGLVLWEARRVRGLGLVSAGMAAVGMLMSLTRASWLASFGLVTVTSIWRRAFIYLWENLQLRALTLAFLGLAWSPAVTSGTDPDEETGRTVAVE